MRRREFIALFGGAAAWPLAARAQQPAMPVVGYLDAKASAASSDQVAAFRQGLKETGFVEGHDVAIEFRWAENALDRLPALAADLVHRRVAAIIASNIATPAAKAATSTIPIVFVSALDPVESGLVTSLARPSGNVTGVGFVNPTLNPKRLELLHELVPKPATIALLFDPNARFLEDQLKDMQKAAQALGRQILIVMAGTESEIDAAFAKIVQAGAGAVFVGSGPFYYSKRQKIAALATSHGLPSSYTSRESVMSGGLMSYGASTIDAYRRGGAYVGRILKGAKPSDLAVELPTRYELMLNLATAKALKIDIPPKLLALADALIE